MIRYDPNKKRQPATTQRPVAAVSMNSAPTASTVAQPNQTTKNQVVTQTSVAKPMVQPTATAVAQTTSALQPTANPGAYQSSYQAQLDALYEQINNNQFNYSLNGDPLWQQAQAYYAQQGQRAMQDAMGQAAALTGGYGSSYAQSVGQQAYNQYIQELMGLAPQFEQQARDRYDREQNALYQQYAMMQDKENQDYSRWADDYSRWFQEQQAALAQQNWQAEMDEDKRRWDETKSSGGSSYGGSSSSGSADYYEVDGYMAYVAQKLVDQGVGIDDLMFALSEYYTSIDDDLLRTVWAYMRTLRPTKNPSGANPTVPGKNPNEIWSAW